MNFILQCKNEYGEVNFFQNWGGNWHAQDTRRLIERTTPNRADARTFPTREAAQEILTVTEAQGWEIVEVPESRPVLPVHPSEGTP